MLSIPDIGMLAPAFSAASPEPHNARQAATEFDAMVLELLLRQSGLLRSLGAHDGEHASLLSDMFLQTFARELAAQMDLGFGSLLVNRAAWMNEGEKP